MWTDGVSSAGVHLSVGLGDRETGNYGDQVRMNGCHALQ